MASAMASQDTGQYFMAHKVFWSWQSDAPKRETRDLIQVALYAAVQDIAGEFDKAKRVEVDQDVKGVVGMAPIAETILEKIDAAAVFVGDVTPIAVSGKGKKQKKIPNPNVMLELGYARHALGMSRLLPIFNRSIRATRFEDMPFDLRHLTGAVGYELAVGASKSELRRVRAELRKRLAEKLRAMIASAPSPAVIEPSWHNALPHDPSIWEEAYNPLPVNRPYSGQIDLVVAPLPRIFARMVPAEQAPPPKFSGGLFPNPQDALMPIAVMGNVTAGRTGNGHAAFQSPDENRTTKSIARWYKDNGEIWAISSWGFYERDGNLFLAYDEIIKDLVAWISRTVRTLGTAGGSGPISLRLGACGLRKVQWWLSPPNPESSPFFGLNDLVSSESKLATGDHDLVIEAVSKFMDELTGNFAVPDLTSAQVKTLSEDS